MRPPRTLLIALTSVLATAMSPVFATDQPKTEQVEIQIDLEASPEEQIRSIREQARVACMSDADIIYPAARNAVRRDCIKQVVADVLAQLPVSDGTQLAKNE